MYIVGTFAILTPITNSLLYLFRVCAIYGYSKAITAFFGFWWLAVIGTNFLVPFGLHGSVSQVFYATPAKYRRTG